MRHSHSHSHKKSHRLLSRWVTVSSENVRFRTCPSQEALKLLDSRRANKLSTTKLFCSRGETCFYRSKSSNSTPLSVFSSRYFTITGV